jgi:hypothetical protein
VRSLARQAARRRVYSLTALVAVVVAAIVFMLMLLGAGQKKAAEMYREMYRNPPVALRDIFARHETGYRLSHGRYATLDELVKEGGVPEEVLERPVEGFRYRLLLADQTRFLIEAAPEGPEPPGPPGRKPARWFYLVDETHTVRADPARVTTASPIVWSPRDGGWR